MIPQNNNQPRHIEQGPGPVFRIGAPGYSGEVIDQGNRLFFWAPTPTDYQFSVHAGWSNLTVPEERWQNLNEQNQLVVPAGWLKLPNSTASASSVLAGTEAWQGQKREIVNFFVDYAQKIYAQHGVVDTSINLDTVGITRGNGQIFAVPPHYAETNNATANAWFAGLSQDLEAVLSAEPNKDELMQDFRAGMGFLGGQGNA